ncbi:haloacid dehalogenase [Cutibacterium avidum]|nr:haloacid dehalogenase [Cutibacterium avidum]
MTFNPRMVALDIDGTLVDFEGELPDSVRKAVAKVDVPVVLATGRGLFGAIPVHEALGLQGGHAVVSNGAVTATMSPVEIESQVTFDPRPIIDHVMDVYPQALIAVEEVGVGYRLNQLFPAGELQGELHIETIDELRSRPAPRVIIRDPNGYADSFRDLAHSLDLHSVSYVIGWSAWLDITPEGVTKASALDTLCRLKGIDPMDVLAIGDGNNDVEMLQWAGRGVAVGDAPDSVKAIADDVAPCFADGGTAVELGRWF